MNLIWFSLHLAPTFLPSSDCQHPSHRWLKACLFSYHLCQVGQRSIISAYRLGEQPQKDCSPPPGRYLALPESLNGTCNRWTLKQRVYFPQGQTTSGDVSWRGSLTPVGLGYLRMLVLFKNAVAEEKTIKPSVPQLGLEKYTLPKVWFLFVLAAHYPFCYWHLHLSDPGSSALREEHPSGLAQESLGSQQVTS